MRIFKGFTLAEVLITVGIIGVVASLTIPTLITSVSKKEQLAQFKTIYSQMKTALEKISSDRRVYFCYNSASEDQVEKYGLEYSLKGGTPDFESKECGKFWKNFTENIGVARTCEDDDVSRCLGETYIANLDVSNSCDKTFENFHRAWILENGMYIFQDGMGEEMFAVDINGKKGPNKWGEDIYPFDIVAVASNKIGGKVYATKVDILPLNCEEGVYTAQMLEKMSGK
ncbi:type II secretion system protein [bacterium]|nr:type II secretion system protein [bacterium]